MFFDILSIIGLVGLIVFVYFFILEKRKTKEQINSTRQILTVNKKELQDVISKNRSETDDAILEHFTITVDMYLNVKGNAEIDRILLDEKISESNEKLKSFVTDVALDRILLDAEFLEINQKLQALTTNAELERENIEKKISKNFEILTDQLRSQIALIEKLRADNEDLRKKLSYFSEIGSDSTQLDEEVNFDEEESKLADALLNIDDDEPVQKEYPNFVNSSVFIYEDIANDNNNASAINRSTLDPEQRSTFLLMEKTNDNIFVTGKAGTGKSFLLKVFMKATKKKTLVVSPTGISALSVDGVTVHSAFGFTNLETLKVEQINSGSIRLNNAKKAVLREIDALIIDEISMIRVDTFDKMDRILRVINNKNIPFGGKQILAFGDLFQLPPVAKGNLEKQLRENYGGIFFFSSNAYKEGNFKFVELVTNHRQKKDETFFELLNRMRDGSISDSDISLVNKRVNNTTDDLRRVVRLFPTKLQAETVNQKELDSIPAKEYSYESKVLFTKFTNQNFNYDDVFPLVNVLKLKLGALVMLVNNDPRRRWANGTLGIVSYISDDAIKVMINGIEHNVPRHIFKSQEAVLENGSIELKDVIQIEQYPIVLAYAITIHKSQGKTYKRIACDITDCFVPGQAYVALSRCSSLDGLHLMKAIDNRHIEVNSEARQFYLNSRSVLIH